MKKQFIGALLLSSILFACSDSKDELQPNGKTPTQGNVKNITCNGQSVTGEIEAEANKTTTFKVEIDNVNEKDVVWILNDEVLQTGSFSFTLEGRSGELKIGVPKQDSTPSTRAWERPERTWDLTTVANLRGTFKKGVFIMNDNKTMQSINGYMSFVNNALIMTEQNNILNHINKIDDGYGSNDFEDVKAIKQQDLAKFNNKIYISQCDHYRHDATIAIYDAQTLKHIQTTSSLPQMSLTKITPLIGGKILGRSIDYAYFGRNMYYIWDNQTNNWEELKLTGTDGIEIDDLDKSLDMASYRGNTTIAFAYDSKLIVLDNKTGKFVKEVDFGKGRKVLSIVKGISSTPTVKVLVDAPINEAYEYTDSTHSIQKAELVTMDLNFNILSKVDIKESLSINGKEVIRNTAYYPYMTPTTFNRLLYATASCTEKEIYLPRYSDDGTIRIYALNYSGIMHEIIKLEDEELGHHRITKPMATTLWNQLYINVKNHGESIIYIYDLSKKKQIHKINFNNLDEVMVFPVGHYVENSLSN